MNRWVLIAPLVAVGALAIAAVATYDAPVRSEHLTIYFTGSAAGNLEPCGCPVNPSGGLPRRAAFIDSHRTESATYALVEGGDFTAPQGDLGAVKTEFYLRGLGKMGYRVLTVGPRDLEYGVDALRNLASERGIVLTVANVVDSASGERVFPEYGIVRAGAGDVLGVEFGGTRIGVVGVIGGEDAVLMAIQATNVNVTDPLEAAKSAVAAARRESDLVVVLASTDDALFERLIATSGADAVIAARTLYPADNQDNVGMVNGVAYGYTGYQARRIGFLELTRGPDGRITSALGDLVSLGEDIPDNRRLAAIVAEYRDVVGDGADEATH